MKQIFSNNMFYLTIQKTFHERFIYIFHNVTAKIYVTSEFLRKVLNCK